MRVLLGILTLAAAAIAPAVSAQPSGVFRQAHEIGSGDNSSLDPISRGRVFQITEKIMSRLVRPGLDGKPVGDLAVSWTSNAEATEWTFKLRPNVKFHDGKAFTADDVVYTLKRIQDPKEDSPVRPVLAMISEVAAVDPLTVKMTLKQPFAELPLQLTDYRVVMLPVDSGPTIKTTGIGTGPFKVEKFEPRGTTVLVANPDYWQGAPGVARMEIIGIADAQARFQALLGGQIDMLPGLTRQQRPLLERSGKHAVQEVRTGNWRGVVFRTDVKPFDDPRVRKAIRLAVDRTALLNLVVGANGGVIGCDTPVGPRDQYRSAKTCSADVAGAKKLLADAGHPNGIDFDLHVSTVESVWPPLAEAFQQLVAPAGIRAKIVSVPSDGYWSQVWRKKDVVMTRWNERPADSAFNEIYRSGAQWNESMLNDPKLDAILDSARRELDFDKRKALYGQAQDQLWETSGTFVAYHVVDIVGMSGRVKGLDAVENFSIRWHLVKVD
jgi:peptide/nickel transport system substrate-binding protein